MSRVFFYIFLLFSFHCYAHFESNDYPHISKKIWDQVEPYFLSKKIKIKKKLDTLFLGLNQNFSKENLIQNGFTFCIDHHLHIHALKHPSVQGYIIKLIPSSDKKSIDWEQWIKRIKGAKIIKNEIKRQKYDRIMVVPKKWIYPFPKNVVSNDEINPHYFALIATDMNILDVSKNHHWFRSKTTQMHLEAIFTMATLIGLADSCKVANIPWTKDGKLAYVDTESYYQWPINYHLLLEFLSSKNKQIWKMMISSPYAR